MNFTDILFNAASGGVVGSLLHLGTSFFETWQKKKNAEVDIMIMNAKVAAAEKEAAWNAFSKSQEGANSSGMSKIPDGASPWVVNLYMTVDAFRNFTRPGLTWFGILFLVVIFFNMDEATKITMVADVQFAAWTMCFWWVGTRYSKSK
jgi:hypothetical protein